MPKFKMTIAKTIHAYADIEVEAETMAEALEAVRHSAESREGDEFAEAGWSPEWDDDVSERERVCTVYQVDRPECFNDISLVSPDRHDWSIASKEDFAEVLKEEGIV